MKMTNKVTRRILTGGLAALLSLGALSAVEMRLQPALALEADCPFCNLAVLKNTPKLDNETTLRHGRKRIEYRCVYCALADAITEFKGDVTIIAPSEKKGKPVTLKRTAGKWSVMPASAVFVAQPVSHRHCQVGYRALTSKAAFANYVKANKKVVGAAKPLSLAQMVAASK